RCTGRWPSRNCQSVVFCINGSSEIARTGRQAQMCRGLPPCAKVCKLLRWTVLGQCSDSYRQIADPDAAGSLAAEASVWPSRDTLHLNPAAHAFDSTMGDSLSSAGGGEEQRFRPSASPVEVERLRQYLVEALQRGATDIHLRAGDAVYARIGGKLT